MPRFFRVIFSFILISLIGIDSLRAERLESAFAIIVDSSTYARTRQAVDLYAKAVGEDGLFVYVLHKEWKNPDELREKIIELSKQNPPLEGIVLIGDIPVAMIRNAQHLTSAFKINQDASRFKWKKTSVPSDRFYDDFDLKFRFIKRDSLNPALFYYALRADSPQKIHSDIYSARIKAPANSDSKYELIDRYLRRIASQKRMQTVLRTVLVFSGHGYHSESLDAWSSEILSYREQFPRLFSSSGHFLFYNHRMDPNLKYLLIYELEKEPLDLAIFHAHGAPNKQYLLGMEPSRTLRQNVEAIKLFLRGKLRKAKRQKKSLEQVRKKYEKEYGFAPSWFTGAFSDSLEQKDSLLYAAQDMYISDIRRMKPQAKLIYFDECFNGAFIDSSYIAGAYVFGSGKVVAAIANSVNVLQDIWADRHLGLLNHGLRIGAWLQLQNSLEKHIIGDPTFHFISVDSIHLDHRFLLQAKDKKLLKKWIEQGDASLRTLAVSLLCKDNKINFEKELIALYKKDPSFNVRLMSLKCLADLRSEAFEALLPIAAKDPSELIRRVATHLMGDTGRKKFIPLLAHLRIFDISERVRFNADRALEIIDPSLAKKYCLEELDKIHDPYYIKKVSGLIRHSFKHDSLWLHNELLRRLTDHSVPLKKRIGAVRTLRTYRFQQAVPVMIKVILNKKENPFLRAATAEALGWYGFNYRRVHIISACEEILKEDHLPENLKDSVLMTKNRLISGANDALAP